MLPWNFEAYESLSKYISAASKISTRQIFSRSYLTGAQRGLSQFWGLVHKLRSLKRSSG